MKKRVLLTLLLAVCLVLTGCSTATLTGGQPPSTSPELALVESWGLGRHQTKHVSLNRSYEWYLDQAHTGEASTSNCGPTCAVMAAKWSDETFVKSVEEARNALSKEGTLWNISDICTYLKDNAIPWQMGEAFSQESALKHLDEGKTLVVCVTMKDISYNVNAEQRTGKFLDGSGGHFLLLKGYRIVDGTTYFEVYDPNSWDHHYADGQPKGKDRYYLAREVTYAVNNWSDLFVIVSGK